MDTVLKDLNDSLHDAMQASPNVYVLGEDILDPYGGAFKVTRGLSTRFPGRVLTSPISEAAIVGIATGMALRGLRPVAEIMFGDFLLLTADQIVNHASKFRGMYNDQVRVPIVIRTPMGGGRGYGPTHSQSLEKFFLGVPGLRTLAINTLCAGQLLRHAVSAEEDPVLLIEHKLLYPKPRLDVRSDELSDFNIVDDGGSYPTFCLSLRTSADPQLTVACYGYMFELVREAVLKLFMIDEIACEIVVFSQISPTDIQPLLGSISKTKRLITVEEGTLGSGWGAEVLASIAQRSSFLRAFGRIGSLDRPIPAASEMEKSVLPSVERIMELASEIVLGSTLGEVV